MSSQCWIWTGSRSSSDGYGRQGKGKLAHRVVYEMLVGPIPSGLEIDHLCRNRICVNPEHLEPVTKLENWRRGLAPTRLNAVKTHCPSGHAYDVPNTYRGTRGMARFCRTCNREAQRDLKFRKKHGLGLKSRRSQATAERSR